MLAVEIYYYGVAEPTILALPGADEAAADSYLQHVRMDVIEAQRHSRRHLRIRPFDRKQDAEIVAPLDIQRVVLADIPIVEDVADLSA